MHQRKSLQLKNAANLRNNCQTGIGVSQVNRSTVETGC
jgi:hypothetical protein